MKKAPFISIVIPNLNCEEYLSTAIDSVLQQVFDDYEILVIDGGSDDGSIETIKKYEKYIKWWCSEKDNGQSEAFNKGFKKARGRFLTWLNSDDIMMPGVLKAVYEKAKRNPDIEWITANFLRFIEENDKIYEAKWGPWFIPKIFQKKNAPIAVFGPTSFFTKKIYEDVGGFDETLSYTMDTEFWMRLVKKRVQQGRLNKYCWAFRMHKDSKTAEFNEHKLANDKKKRALEEQIRIEKKNSYQMSRLLYYSIITWRVLTLSQLVAVWNGRMLVGTSFSYYLEKKRMKTERK